MNRELDIILTKLKSGDERFYKSLFQTYYTPLTYFANKYVKNIEVAKELVQELFVKLFEKRYALAIDTSFKSYLYKSIYNSCINYLNQISIRENHHHKIKDQKNDLIEFSEDEIYRIELEQRIYNEIEKLPAQCKRIFKMNRFEGLSNGDIAEQLNLSKRTVETQISKALKILRKKLSNHITWVMIIISYYLIYFN